MVIQLGQIRPETKSWRITPPLFSALRALIDWSRRRHF